MLNLRKKLYYNSIYRNSRIIDLNSMISIFSRTVKDDNGLEFLSKFVVGKEYNSYRDFKDILDLSVLMSLPYSEIDGNIIEKYDSYSPERKFDYEKSIKYYFDYVDFLYRICRDIPIPDYILENYQENRHEFNILYLSSIIKRLNSFDTKYTLFCEKEMYRKDLSELTKTFIDCYVDNKDNESLERLLKYINSNKDDESYWYLIQKNVQKSIDEEKNNDLEDSGLVLKLK